MACSGGTNALGSRSSSSRNVLGISAGKAGRLAVVPCGAAKRPSLWYRARVVFTGIAGVRRRDQADTGPDRVRLVLACVLHADLRWGGLTHMRDVGIVIVTHNSAEEIGPCLDAAVATGAEVVVVDNASEDETRDEVERRGVRLIANRSNAGFAAAVNQGTLALSTPLLLLLNPDAVIQGGLEHLREACSDPKTAAAGGLLVDTQGKPQAGYAVRRFPSATALCFEALLINRLWPANPVNWHYRCLDLDR